MTTPIEPPTALPLPRSLGMTDMSSIRLYLMGSLPVSELGKPLSGDLRSHSTSKSGVNKPGVLCLIHELNESQKRQRTATHGFSSSQVQPRVTLLSWPVEGARVAAVSLTLWKSGWGNAEPIIIDAVSHESDIVVSVCDVWIEVICRLASKVLQPLLYFNPSQEWIMQGVEREIQARLVSFRERGVVWFFQNVEDAVAWQMTIFWEKWGAQSVTDEQRLLDIKHSLYLPVSRLALLELQPLIVLGRLRSGDPVPQCPLEAGVTIGDHVPSALRDLMRDFGTLTYWVATVRSMKGAKVKGAKAVAGSHSPRGRGGFPDKKFIKDEGDLDKSGLWWWKEMPTKADQRTLKAFHKHWERSAFFYELRARLTYSGGPPKWDGFGKSWWDLDYSQRGILWYLWLPNPGGPGLISRLLRSRKSVKKKNYMVKVDMARPLEDVLSDVELKWKEIGSAFLHLGVVEVLEEQQASEVTDGVEGEGMKADWNLLEILDLMYYCGSDQFTLVNKHRKALQKRLNSYSAACEAAGIPSLDEKFEIPRSIKDRQKS